ncbi:MAG TPA: hypothetical protein PLP57_03080 [Candidatus Saccharicenans sp.]|jgi:hypothetical protein|nr:hypothetical protein [Candidatus Saccharicenans sp.]HRD01613.1 hypothetical protein [Candidatus Saccharicenans sp.]
MKLIGVLAFACLSIFVFLLSLGMAADPVHGGNIFCKDVFPGNCTQGGCGADPVGKGRIAIYTAHKINMDFGTV